MRDFQYFDVGVGKKSLFYWKQKSCFEVTDGRIEEKLVALDIKALLLNS